VCVHLHRCSYHGLVLKESNVQHVSLERVLLVRHAGSVGIQHVAFLGLQRVACGFRLETRTTSRGGLRCKSYAPFML
jgi:hypothetical protein